MEKTSKGEDIPEWVGKVDPKLLELLGKVGKILGAIAPAFAIASFAFDFLKMLGLFKEGPSPLELLVRQKFEELQTTVISLAQLIQSKDLRNRTRVQIDLFNNQVGDYVAQNCTCET